MDFSSASEWLNLLLRWLHVFSAILWIGSTWLFTWMDGWFTSGAAAPGTGANSGFAPIWMVHSGGFYRVEKVKDPGHMPATLHWFKWEAAATFASGFLLLGVVYFWGGGVLLDSDVSGLGLGAATALSLGVLAAGWFVYDGLMISPLGRSEVGAGAVGVALLFAVAWSLLHLLSARAAYLEVGALMGTLMALNVWVRILPSQRRMVAALKAGRPPDSAEGDRAKRRSKQNSFMGVPTVMLMLSNHFPVATYGNDHAFLVLCGLVLVGMGAAKILRSH